MAKKNRAYKSAKRSKELDRLRKREEKRQRRLAGKPESPEEGAQVQAEEAEAGAGAEPSIELEDPEV